MNVRLSCVFIGLLYSAWWSGSAAAQQGATAASAEAQSCLARSNIRRTQILNDSNIVFVTRDGNTYLNELARQCPGLRRDSQVSYTSDQRQFCAGTSFQVLLRVGTGTNTTPITIPGSNEHISLPAPSFIPGPVCALGGFVAVTDEQVDALVEASRPARPSRRERRARRDAPADQ
jgi:hypothetical protein